MRAAHRDAQDVGGGRRPHAALSLPGRPERQAQRGMQALGLSKQGEILKRLRKQGDPARQALRAETGRHRDRGVIQQVHEIGVVAQIAVEPNRLGGFFIAAINGAGGGREHEVHWLHHLVRRALQGLQAVLGFKGFHGAASDGGRDDLARHRMERLRLGFDEGTNRRIALGDPRSFVEQPRRIQHRLQIDLARFAAQRGECGDRRVEAGFGVRVPKKLQRARNTKHKLRRKGDRGAHRARIRVLLIQRTRHAKRLRGIAAFERKNRHAVERAAGRHHAPCAQGAARGLQSHQIIKRRRHATGACGIRA